MSEKPKKTDTRLTPSFRRKMSAGIFAAGVATGALTTHALEGGNGSTAPDEEKNKITYVVQPGDTAWDIARKYAPKNSEIRDDVDEMESQHDGNFLQPGDIVQLPSDLEKGFLAEQEQNQQAQGPK